MSHFSCKTRNNFTSLKVIGSGFGRTGTLSRKAALEILGFAPCYHMEEVIKRPSHINMWYHIGCNQLVPWQKIFGRFQATVDFPASIFYRELLDHYPEAKVVHTVRDPERCPLPPHVNDREMILWRFKMLQRTLTWAPIGLAALTAYILWRTLR